MRTGISIKALLTPAIGLAWLALCAGSAGASGAAQVDTTKPIEIVMYTLGDALPDQDKVLAEINSLSKAKLNTTLKVNNIPWADWTNKYNLILASGEYFDTFYTGNWSFYFEQATKNAFREISLVDVKKHMPEYFAQVPPSFWPQVKVDGKIYMLPSSNPSVLAHRVVLLRGDLREKYGLAPLKTLNDYNRYLTTVAQNEKELIAYNCNIDYIGKFVYDLAYKQANNLTILLPSGLPGVFSARLDTVNPEVIYMPEDPAFIAVLDTMKKLYDAGVFPKNAIMQQDNIGLETGKSASYAHHWSQTQRGYSAVMESHPEYKPEIMDIWPNQVHEVDSAAVHGMALGPVSKNVGRTMALINLFNTNKDITELFIYGIKGVHWEPVGEKKYKSLPGSTGWPVWGFDSWAFNAPTGIRQPANVPDFIISMTDTWAKQGLLSKSPIVGFAFDDSNVKNEMAACLNVVKSKGYLLLYGNSRDVRKDLEAYRNELKQAGIDKIKSELQSQLAAYMKAAQ